MSNLKDWAFFVGLTQLLVDFGKWANLPENFIL